MNIYYPKPGDDLDLKLYELNTSEKICNNHINDTFIKQFISKNSFFDICSYCNRKSKVIDLSEILEIIIDGINYLYEDPVNSRYINDGNLHGYDGDTIYFNEIWDELNIVINDTNLSNHIFEYLNNTSLYCRKNEFNSKEEDLKNLWDHFKDIVKYKARFVFHFKDTFSDLFLSDPIDILNQVQDAIIKFNLFKDLPLNTKLYRCRQHDSNTIIKDCKDLASAPLIYAKTNGRMNPAGISMFYASENKDLTIKEVVEFSDNKKPYYSTGIFSTKETLKLIDLTNIPNYPSIFDKSMNDYIEIILFLKSFIEDITKPYHHDESIIEYIPTQIITEYIRFNPKLNVQGIIYPSSKNNILSNIVLFYNHEESKKNLNFDNSSIERFQI